MNVTNLMIWGGLVTSAGALSYKLYQSKVRGKEVDPKVDMAMYAGLSAVVGGFALKTLTSKTAPVKVK